MINVDFNKCTGCGACAQTCPTACIKMVEDINGFVFPSVTAENCKKCGLCMKACPIEKQIFYDEPIETLAAVSLDRSMLMNATSGGVFGAIAEYIFEHKGVVYGCAYVENLSVQHIRVEDARDICKLQGSKYVQSDTKDTFTQVKKDLLNGRMVLYSGTPCQIAGLRAFLGKEYENLITIDIVCHGVPSYAFFNKYVKWYETKNDVLLTAVLFRSKENRGWSCAGVYTGKSLKTGKLFKKKLNHFDSYYYYYFLSSDIYRNSCYVCDYAKVTRVGDFSLGDFWGAESLNLPFTTHKGCSLILVNTEKAKRILNELKLLVYETSLETAVKYNEQLQRPSEKSEHREEILRRNKEWNAEKMQKVFLRETRSTRIKRKLKALVPIWLKNLLLKIRYKIGE